MAGAGREAVAGSARDAGPRPGVDGAGSAAVKAAAPRLGGTKGKGWARSRPGLGGSGRLGLGGGGGLRLGGGREARVWGGSEVGGEWGPGTRRVNFT